MFRKYNSIENTYRDEFLERIKGHGFWNEKYVVQEKVHGSNLSYWTTDGIEFHSAKRTGILEAHEKFYNYLQVLEEIKPQLQTLWKELKTEYDDLKQMTVYGELFGGNYPHPDVAKDKKAIRLQKGIFYSPHNLFYAFDIMLNTEEFLDVDITNSFFEKSKLFHAETLFSGTIEECLKYPNDFDSVIPAQLGLPEIKPNICEGVVIRPIKTLRFNNNVRIILKNKNEKWAEKARPKKRAKPVEKLPENILKLQEAIMEYVTENRLNNVLSKIGEVTQKDFGKVMGMFSKDIVEDFTKDYKSALDELDKKEIKIITKSFMKQSSKLVRGVIFEK